VTLEKPAVAPGAAYRSRRLVAYYHRRTAAVPYDAIVWDLDDDPDGNRGIDLMAYPDLSGQVAPFAAQIRCRRLFGANSPRGGKANGNLAMSGR